MNKIFETFKIDAPNKNMFDLSHESKLTFNMGELVPFYKAEVLPSDKFSVDSTVLLRFQPMLAPIMHRIDIYTHYFYVPNRLITEDWEDFITGGVDGDLTPTLPTVTIDNGSKASFYKGTLANYLGVPPVESGAIVSNPIDISALPFRAYQKIYNDYYRDQTLTAEIDIELASDTVITTLRKRAWEKDYFTSCLPWTQRGDEVTLNIGDSALHQVRTDELYPISSYVRNKLDNTAASNATFGTIGVGGQLTTTGGDTDGFTQYIDNSGVMETDLSSATSTTINELRRAFKLQEWLEAMARGGSRYTEQLKVIFNVQSSDARLQRPEYLGGGKQPMTVSEVVSTAAVREFDSNDIRTPQGQMTGHAISVGKSNSFTRRFEEHGWVIGIISVLPRTGYSQGIEKCWLRESKEEYYWPQFAQLGEQEVLNKELYHDYEGAADEGVFGYQQRYIEYKYQFDKIAGDFVDDFEYWHLNRKFTSQPTLSTEFIECDASHRIFAVTDTNIDKIFGQIYNRVKAERPIPYFNIPTL